MTQERGDKKRKSDMWGWCLFIVSAVFFVASTVNSGDLLGIIGSLFFLVACIVFLVPYLKTAE